MAAKGKIKTKTQLLNELAESRKRIAELEAGRNGGSDNDERLRRANRTLDAIRIIAGVTAKDKVRDTILGGICDGLVETQGYTGAWIGVTEDTGAITVVVSASFRDAGERMIREGLPDCVHRAMAQPQALIIEDPASVCGACPVAPSYPNCGLMSVRLDWGGKALGVLAVYAPQAVVTDWQEQTLFQELARHLAFGLANMTLKRGLRVAELRARIVHAVTVLPDDRMYRDVLNVLLEATRSPHGVFGYLDESGAFVVPNVPTSAEDAGDGAALVFPVDTWGNAAGQRALREKRTLWTNDSAPETPGSILQVKRQVSVPIVYDGETLGLLQVANKESDYSAADLELVESMVRELAPALSARLRREREGRARVRSDEAHRVARQEMEALLRRQAEDLGRIRKSLHDETSRRERAQAHSRRHGLLSTSIGAIFQDTLACQTDEDVVRVCLGHAQRITESAYGYFARVNAEGTFDVMAMGAVDTADKAPAEADPVARVKNVEIRGVWGKVLRGGEPQIVNDPGGAGERMGMPEGSPPLTSFISVPVRLSGTIVGAIALANKSAGFDEIDLDVMEGVSRLFAEALRLHRSEAALRDARREVARRDSLALLGQLTGEEVESAAPLRKSVPPRRHLFSWLNQRGAAEQVGEPGTPRTVETRKCSVLIASSRPAFKDAVRGAVSTHDWISVLDSADLDEEGILTARGTHPDIIVVDISAAGMSGFRTIARIREQLPEARVVAVGPYASKSIRFTARESGADRLLLGDFQPRELVDAIRGLVAPSG